MVRTLHHYDSIGLVVPDARTAAGYRLYTDADLFRLQQILIGRELGLLLEEIRRAMDGPRFDRQTALLDQRERLIGRVGQTEAMIRAIDAALDALQDSRKKGEMKMEDLFEGFDPSRYEDEVRHRWGTSEAFVESERRARRYTPDDWKALKAEQAAAYDDAHSALQAGQRPCDEAVMEIAERHRLSIDRWFYPCRTSPLILRSVAPLADASLTKHSVHTLFTRLGRVHKPSAVVNEVHDVNPQQLTNSFNPHGDVVSDFNRTRR